MLEIHLVMFFLNSKITLKSGVFITLKSYNFSFQIT